ncbi:bifunctional folylpolyglutamate synthase/dihydrofolate synthase [Anaerosphaera multitolerans]|uniref:tetrahydrofolate synthase n=1 Tax=Anaerosphaera multitolerans TaxID=2487351 RepID=A0A437S7T2_9FIRM|nr:folylpolyglutamate synthase/dihydrofolate synthase family protein [Anaerosphaera multitolerans]RVU54907.1 bifunctional folylpolyglutamate synthase/dihydrofolate synthase [Anaerosphaera multitolerans]
MNFKEVIKNIESREGKRKSYDFKRMKSLLRYLDNPHLGVKYLHVAGTNGKGSTSKFLYSIINSGDYKVGLYTSPHLERYTERIVVNDREISEEDFTSLSIKVLKAEEKIIDDFEMLTYFEFITAVGFLYFKENKCDYCVLEVGMGGLSDSTNVVETQDKILSVITPISMDHMQFLGNTIEEIAHQKTGIIREGVLCTSSNTDPEIRRIVKEKALEKNAPFYDLSDLEILNLEIDKSGSKFDLKFKDEILKDLEIKMVGYYQLDNAALSIMSIMELRNRNLLSLSDEEIRAGVKRAFWPGRMEKIRENPLVLLDGAHNFDGILRLTESFKLFKYEKLTIITSILDDKEHEKMIHEFSKYADKLIIVDLSTSRKTELTVLLEEANKYMSNVSIISSLKEAIDIAVNNSTSKDMIVISGSLYLVSETKELINKSFKDA